jgi:hypothetical protein
MNTKIKVEVETINQPAVSFVREVFTTSDGATFNNQINAENWQTKLDDREFVETLPNINDHYLVSTEDEFWSLWNVYSGGANYERCVGEFSFDGPMWVKIDSQDTDHYCGWDVTISIFNHYDLDRMLRIMKDV